MGEFIDPAKKPFTDEDILHRIEVVVTKDNRAFVSYPTVEGGTFFDPVVAMRLLGHGLVILSNILQKQIEQSEQVMMKEIGIIAPEPRIIVPGPGVLPIRKEGA